MEAVKLPTEKAYEPTEEAHQPVRNSSSTAMSSQEPNNFAEDTMSTENEPSQNSSAYKEVLSQPAAGISHKQRLAWLQKRRGAGLWVQCDECNAWRHLPHVLDSHQLPPKWYCSMNPDKSVADCSSPEAPLRISDEEDLIHSEYSCGSLVWARMSGWPWWPAMVDDEPDTEQFYWLDGFSDIPTHYNVVFFDVKGATRAWMTPENLQPYTPNKKKYRLNSNNSSQYKKRFEKSIQEAEKAEKLPVVDRLAKFSFISTYKGPINSPKKVNKKDLEVFQKKLKRKFNVEFPIESSSESDGESIQALREMNKKKNVILIGTPKSKKPRLTRNSNKDKDNATVYETVHEKKIPKKNQKVKSNDKKVNQINGENCDPEQSGNDYDKNLKNKNDSKSPKKAKASEVVKATKKVNNASAAATEAHEQSFKVPNSMATEIGSTPTLNLGSQLNGIDNDKSVADCSSPEAPLRISDEEDLIHSEYSCGSLVWARMSGWPWWPAMVDDEPDTEQFYWLDGFSDIPTHYNVVFFDVKGATRAWMTPENLQPYTPNKKKYRLNSNNSSQYKKRFEKSIQEAEKAEKLPVVDRLAKFSFISTYKGPINSPKKVNKKDLEVFQKKLKRKFNVEFPIESSSESDGESIQALREMNKKKNVILIGTPKSKKPRLTRNSNKDKDNATVYETVHEKKIPKKNQKVKSNDKKVNQINGENCDPEQSGNDYDKNLKNKNDSKSPKKAKASEVVKATKKVNNASAAATEAHEQSFKVPNSMATEIGSTPTLNLGSQLNGIDNDSSKTYVPETEKESDPVDITTDQLILDITQDFPIRVETPSSDDFDF